LIVNPSGATVNITGGTLANNCYVAGATTEFLAIENSGNVTIPSGSITSYGQSATINQNGGTLNVSGGEIIAHHVTKGQAIYIAGGTTTISGSAYLENVSGTGESRGCVDNNGGTLNITGGTIVSKGYNAVMVRKNGTTTQIGTDDDIIDISSPVLRGKNYGLEKASAATTATIKVYDGIFESLNQNQAISTTSVTKPQDIDFITDATVNVDGVTYNAAYLLAPSITINFYEETNGTAIPVVVDNGSSFGNDLPTPNPKQGYLFAGWFIDGDPLKPVTSETVVTGPFTVYAKWVQSVANATFDDTMTIQINTTDTIEFEEDDIEDVTYASSNTNVVTVDSDGTVHAVGVGTATITMTGALSGDIETVDVTVTQIMRTVKFYDSDYDPNDLEHSTLLDTVQVVSGSTIGANMPTPPSNANYVLNAWYIDGNSVTPFTNETTVNGDLVVVANWKEKVTYATLTTTPSPFEILVGDTGQITLTARIQGDAVEDYTFTSGNTNYATVNSSTGLVTGAGIGDTNITVTGSLSHETVQVPVSVDVLKYTVTFKDGNNVIKTVKVESGHTVGAEMPSNQTKTDYIFNGWVYDNNNTLTPFTSATEVYGDIDVLVSWKEQINIATLPDDPTSIIVGADKTILVTATGEGNLVEDYTLSSSNTNLLEVNGKIITGSSVGSVTLTITGVESHLSETITVNVVNSYSVTFDPDNGETPTVIYVEIDSSIDDSGETIPTDPTKSDVVFDNWYIYDEVNETLTNTRLDTSATVTSDMIYK
ncbi:MAG: InlB B-repeat-containing protein, partial [Bacilli bacterium]|nr:InlB B-repeat-containing protein [Bacilli bacterium]